MTPLRPRYLIPTCCTLALLLLTATSAAQSLPTGPPPSEILPTGVIIAGDLEIPMGVVLDDGGATVQVASGGCTEREHFRFEYADGVIRMFRMAPDRCQARLFFGVTYRFTWDEMGVPHGETIDAPRFWQGERTAAGGAPAVPPIAGGPGSTSHPSAPAEAIFGVVTSREGATFQVDFGGCGAREHFRFELDGSTLWLIRTEPDLCELYAPLGTTFTFTWADMGVDTSAIDPATITIGNPIHP